MVYSHKSLKSFSIDKFPLIINLEGWLTKIYVGNRSSMGDIDMNKTSDYDELNCSALLAMENTVCMEDPEEMLKPWKTNPLFFEIVIVYLTTFTFGVCGNIIVVGVLARSGKARSVTNSFLVSLAIGDLLMLCVYGPLETYTHFVIQWDEKGSICRMAKFAEFLSATSSVLNLLAVTLERFFVILFPIKSRAFCTSGNTLKAIMTVWLLSILLASPIIFTTDTYKIAFANRVTKIVLNYCNHSTDSPFFAIYQFFVIFFMPGIIMAVCYALVVKELWMSTRKMERLTKGARKRVVISNNDEINAARKQVIRMLILVVALFYISWGPRLSMELLQKFYMVPFTQNSYLLRIILNFLTFFHGCINPFIYSFMSKNFRNSLTKQFDKLRCRKGTKWFVSEGRKDLTRRCHHDRQGFTGGEKSPCESGEPKCSHCSFTSSDIKSTEVESLLSGSNATHPHAHPNC